MAEESNLGKSFLRGVGALAAALVLFAGEQFIQHHYWPDKAAPPSAGNDNHEPAAPAMIPIAGRVVDAVGTKAIENAVDAVLASNYRTADIAQPGCRLVGCKEMGRLVREKLG